METNRVVTSGMPDIYQSAVGNRVNREVRALTLVAIGMMATVATTLSIIFWRRRRLE